jgi:serine/threonine protein kinase
MNKSKFNYNTHPKTLLNFNQIYKDVKMLGSGFFGETHLIMEYTTKKLYTLKILNTKYLDTDDYYREVEALIKLSQPTCHSSLVCYQNHFMMIYKNKIKYCILTDYIEGITLEKYDCQYQLSYNNIVDIGLWLLKTVMFLHQNGFAHNDISTANIIVTSQGGLKLIDFGLSCLSTYKTKYIKCTSNRLVNNQYKSPEIQTGLYKTNPNQYSKTSDCYAIGLVLYELLTDKQPYQLDFYGNIKSHYKDIKQLPCYNLVLKKLLIINPNQRSTANAAYQQLLKCKKV